MVGSRVYVGGLPYGVRERDLERFFKGYGRTRDILIKNGYGFVVSIKSYLSCLGYYISCREEFYKIFYNFSMKELFYLKTVSNVKSDALIRTNVTVSRSLLNNVLDDFI